MPTLSENRSLNRHTHKKKKKNTINKNRANKKRHYANRTTTTTTTRSHTKHPKRNIWNNWEKRNITFPKRKHFTLRELDNIPHLDELGQRVDIKNEREEQYVSHDYIMPHSTVLELGARYGVVSCVINHKLEHPTHHVCVEPDASVIACLKDNRKAHKAHFRIVNGIISNKKVYLKKSGYASRVVSAASSSTDSATIPTYTIQQLETKYNLQFDTLVADCEGCLGEFIEENEHFVSHQLKHVMFEADLPQLCDYNKIRKLLRAAGFKVVVNGFVSFWTKGS